MDKDYLVPPEAFLLSQGVGGGDFKKIGDGLTDRFRKRQWIDRDSIVLDIGCGLGRIARPLTDFLWPPGAYYGFDINKSSIDWCNNHYAEFDNFHFQWIDLQSTYYSPDGRVASSDFTFPLSDGTVDFVNLTSVFTHMLLSDVRHYLFEISRMLKPGGHTYITYFLVDKTIDKSLEDGAAEGRWSPVDGGYIKDPICPEKVVLLKEDTVRHLYDAAGLQITDLSYGRWAQGLHSSRQSRQHGGYQDEIVAFKP